MNIYSLSTETSVSTSLGSLLYSIHLKTSLHVLLWAVSVTLFFQLTIQWWRESDEMSQTEGPWWEPFPECMNAFPPP